MSTLPQLITIYSDKKAMSFSLLFVSIFFSLQSMALEPNQVRLQSLKVVSFNQQLWSKAPAHQWGLKDLVFLSNNRPDETLIISQKITTDNINNYCMLNSGTIAKNYCFLTPSKNAFQAVQISKFENAKTGKREPAFFTSFYLKGNWTLQNAKSKMDTLINKGLLE